MTEASVRTPWQRALGDAVVDPKELLTGLNLPLALLPAARSAARLFPLRVPRGYVARMRIGDLADPLLRQVLPLAAEHEVVPGFSLDAVGDLRSARGGLLQKYQGRALLIATGACAVNCRFCFRRHFPYAEQNASRAAFSEALEQIAADEGLSEVILSGGDPLTLSDRRLANLVDALDAIPHLRRLRVHTRQPVVLPERIDEALLRWLGRTRLQTVFVLHANHGNEIDNTVTQAVRRLHAAGATLLNQAVLLRGVNDSATALVDLSERLFAIGILPYYLHLLDRVRATAHFEVSEARGRALIAEMRGRLPGYLVPRLAREEPGRPAKTVIA